MKLKMNFPNIKMTDSKMTQSALEVKRILQSNRVNEGYYSHVSLVIPRGKYSLSSVSLSEEFWRNYCQAIRENEDVSFGIAEVPQSFIPILIDIDLKFTPDSVRFDNGHFYSTDLVCKVVSVYQKILREYISFEEKDDLEYFLKCFWLDKEAYEDGKGMWKNGFHLHFPHIFVSKIEQETRLIPAVKKQLDENFDLYGIDSSIIDGRAVGNTWLLYGSVKAEGLKPYKLAGAFSAHAEQTDVKSAIMECKLFDANDDSLEITEDFEHFLPRIFSIFPSNKRCFDIKKKEGELQEFIHQRIGVQRKPSDKASSAADIKKVEQLCDLLSSKRAEGHDDWMTVGWAIFNITDGSSRGLDIWIKFSLRTDDHDADRCAYEWTRMTNRRSYTLGTLIHFAKKDNPAGLKRFVARNNQARENFSEYGLAEIFYEHCQEKFAFCNCTNTWYLFMENFWEEDRNALFVRKEMLDVLKTLLDSIHREKVSAISEEEDGKREGIETDPATIARNRLNKIGFINAILEFCKIKFAVKDFAHQLNANKYLIGFKNGVYDLKNNIFREGHPADLISNRMTIAYKDFDEGDPRVLETLSFFEKVLPVPSVRQYFMDVMSEVFIGYNHRKKVYFWTGDGDNGKSMTQMLIAKMLGPLCVKAPTTLVTSKRGASGSANAEMARLGNGVRLVFLEEPDPSEGIYQGIFKHLSGNDDFYARDLYQSGKDLKEIVAMFKIIIICNDLPKIHGGGDRATWNRVRVVPFSATFKKDAPVLAEEQIKTSTFPIDTELDQKIPEMTEPLAWILLKHFQKPKGEDPPEVLRATMEYQTSNDFLVGFMAIHVSEDQAAVTSKFEFYDLYKDYCKESCSGARPLTFIEFIKSLTRKIGAPNGEDGESWKGYRLKYTQSAENGANSAKEFLMNQ